ncbi:tail fiber domain-containing protein [Flavobacterium sp.]|jgi:hypothetical protein|uniref:tail fiber domain-containing protein n=1 Tax=Flavobacterium sp. TaxID=239 RepID=UPI0037BE6110
MGGNDRIVVTNNTGVLNNVSVAGLVTANAWGLSGNSITAAGGTLGAVPTGSFLGATSNQNLQLVTNNLVRAIVTAGGVFQTNNVAIGGGAINGTTIGATTASTGRFTTLDTTGNAAVAGTLGVTGATTLASTLGVTGATTLSSTLGVTGATTLGGATQVNNTLTVTGDTTLNSNLGVGGNGSITGTLGVTGATTLSSTLGVSGATTLGSTLGVTGVTTLTNLGASLNTSMGGNDRIVVTNNTGVLNNVSVAGLVTANAWGLSGNAIGASGDGNTNLNGAPAGSFLGSTTSQPLQFVAGNVVRAIIDDSGEFRIQNIDVRNGAINNTTIGATAASTGRFTTVEATGNATVAGTLGVTGLTTASGGVRTPSVNGTTALALTADAGTLSLEAAGANVITASTNGAERLRIASDGNVGIGTNNPTNLLEVNGTFRAVGNSSIGGTLDVTGATSLSTLTASGAVTLSGGTVNGVAYLNGARQLTTGTALTFDGTNLATTGTATARKFTLAIGGNNGGNGMYMPVSSVLAFSTNGGERLRIDTSGDVGIGTNNPQRRLDVDGTFRASGAGEIGGTLAVTGGIENTAIGAVTASTGRFTTLAATGNATVAGTLGVAQATTLSSTLTVDGASTLTGAVTANGGIDTSNLNASGTGTFGGLLTASNGLSTTTLTTSGDGTVGGVLRATGGIENTAIGTITPNTGRFTTLVATGTTTLTGLLTANGGVGTTTLTTSGAGIIGGALRVDGVTELVGALTVNGTTTLVNTLNADGGVSTPTLEVTGGSSVGGLFEADGGITTTTLAASGDMTLQPATSASITPALRFTDIAGDNFVGFRAPNVLAANRIWTLPTGDGDGGNVLSTDGSGNLVWVNPVTAGAAWALSGNGATSSSGTLGNAPAPGSNFIGTTNSVDLRLVTNNLVRAVITASGQFQTNNVLIGGGAINNTAIGSGGANTGAFTALSAASLETTGNASVGGALAVTGSATVDGLMEAKGGLQTTTLGVTGATTLSSLSTSGATVLGTTLQVNGATTLGGTLGVTGLLTADGGLLTDAITTDTLTANDWLVAPELTAPLVTSSASLQLATAGASNFITINTSGVERLRIGGDGRVGIGTGATIGAQLQVNTGLADTIGLIVRGAAGQTASLFEVQDSSGAGQVIVDASGAMSIGTGAAATGGNKLEVNGNVRVTGDVVANNFNQSSDARFKTNIQAITDALSIVRKLQGVSYDWNRAAFPDRGFSPRPQIGVIAQDVERILPELVSTDAQGFKSVNYTGFIPVLIEGMKQQADRLDAQDARLVTAEQTLAMVEERLFKAEEQVIKIDERVGRAEAFVARFELTREPDTMIVLTPTFKVQNLTADRAYIEELRAARIEADKARFKELDADGAVIDNVEAARLRGRVVNTGGKELFVSFGTVAPLFEAVADGHYIVSVTADDGSFATAQVVNAGGVVRVVPTASQGIDVVANGNSVGLVAPSKKVKASWTRTG